MHAHIEPVVAILRIFEPGKDYGDPYVWTCTVRWLNLQEVELDAASRAPTPAEWRAVSQRLHQHGVRWAYFDRKGGSKPGRRRWQTTAHKQRRQSRP